MDETILRLAAYAHALAFDQIDADSVHQTKRRVIDTLGCALGAHDAPPSRIARTLAERATARPGRTAFPSTN